MSTAKEERAMVARLSVAQRDKLSRHRDRAPWRTWGQDRFYVDRLLGEVAELLEVIYTGKGDPWSEAADVANFAAMLADRQTADR